MSTKQLTSSRSAYLNFSRAEWAVLSNIKDIGLTEAERVGLQSINEVISADEVSDIYLPLSQLLYMHMNHYTKIHNDINEFLHRKTKRSLL